MKTALNLLFASLVGLFVLTGCRTATVYNVQEGAVETKAGVTDEQVYKAIKTAGTNLGWVITKTKPGLAQGQLNLRGNMAQVEIPYSTKTYSILYKNSNGLKYNASNQTIHQNYNGWIQNLDNAIRIQLNTLAD